MTPYILLIPKSVFNHMRKAIAIVVLAAFIGTSVHAPVYAQAVTGNQLPWMPVPGVRISLSPEFTPALLKGITIHPDNPLQFDFIILRGDKTLNDAQKRLEYKKLIKYFLASLTVPENHQWVNLSPYEKSRIITGDLGKTEMGRDMLAQDYVLKQMTASLIYPESNLGKKFWNTVYAQAQKQFGSSSVPVNTFNKVWIVPDDAQIYEKGNTAYVISFHLKVMLEEDYTSLKEHTGLLRAAVKETPTHALGSRIVREIVLPALEKEVNEGKNFANLRQVFSGVILAAWFKQALKESLLGQIYANKGKLKGVDQNPRNNQLIYQRYLKAYKKGVFNYIKEDIDKYTNASIPRKYFSGGEVVPPFQSYAHMVANAAAANDVAGQLEEADDAVINMQEAGFKANRAMVSETLLRDKPKYAQKIRAGSKYAYDSNRAMTIKLKDGQLVDERLASIAYDFILDIPKANLAKDLDILSQIDMIGEFAGRFNVHLKKVYPRTDELMDLMGRLQIMTSFLRDFSRGQAGADIVLSILHKNIQRMPLRNGGEFISFAFPFLPGPDGRIHFSARPGENRDRLFERMISYRRFAHNDVFFSLNGQGYIVDQSLHVRDAAMGVALSKKFETQLAAFLGATGGVSDYFAPTRGSFPGALDRLQEAFPDFMDEMSFEGVQSLAWVYAKFMTDQMGTMLPRVIEAMKEKGTNYQEKGKAWEFYRDLRSGLIAETYYEAAHQTGPLFGADASREAMFEMIDLIDRNGSWRTVTDLFAELDPVRQRQDVRDFLSRFLQFTQRNDTEANFEHLGEHRSIQDMCPVILRLGLVKLGIRPGLRRQANISTLNERLALLIQEADGILSKPVNQISLIEVSDLDQLTDDVFTNFIGPGSIDLPKDFESFELWKKAVVLRSRILDIALMIKQSINPDFDILREFDRAQSSNQSGLKVIANKYFYENGVLFQAQVISKIFATGKTQYYFTFGFNAPGNIAYLPSSGIKVNEYPLGDNEDLAKQVLYSMSGGTAWYLNLRSNEYKVQEAMDKFVDNTKVNLAKGVKHYRYGKNLIPYESIIDHEFETGAIHPEDQNDFIEALGYLKNIIKDEKSFRDVVQALKVMVYVKLRGQRFPAVFWKTTIKELAPVIRNAEDIVTIGTEAIQGDWRMGARFLRRDIERRRQGLPELKPVGEMSDIEKMQIAIQALPILREIADIYQNPALERSRVRITFESIDIGPEMRRTGRLFTYEGVLGSLKIRNDWESKDKFGVEFMIGKEYVNLHFVRKTDVFSFDTHYIPIEVKVADAAMAMTKLGKTMIAMSVAAGISGGLYMWLKPAARHVALPSNLKVTSAVTNVQVVRPAPMPNFISRVLMEVTTIDTKTGKKTTYTSRGDGRWTQRPMTPASLFNEARDWMAVQMGKTNRYVSPFQQPSPTNANVPKTDRAMNGLQEEAAKGGIDFNTANFHLKIKRDGRGVALPIAQQDMASLSKIDGLVPDIVTIKPATSMPLASLLEVGTDTTLQGP